MKEDNTVTQITTLFTSSDWQKTRGSYVRVLINLWLFLFAAQPKEFFLDGSKKLEQRSQKCVELRREYVNRFFQSRSFFYIAKDLSAPLIFMWDTVLMPHSS
jgi:hypothetical protein